ncbi:MAG: UDP-N-acetylmuramoyl-tripeptide--D-alanyl-D-alanine ligase [Pseudomonadota bacterium]
MRNTVTQALWTAKDAVNAMNGQCTGDWIATGIAIDNRDVAAGDLFFALHGEKLDGHDFIAGAFANGAVAAVVNHIPLHFRDDTARFVVVADTLQALRALGRAARQRSGMKAIAVTGSVGKTGTKEMLAVALAGQGQTHAGLKSFNNHTGVPLTLARTHAGTDFGIYEMGMNHAGELSDLTTLVQPDIAIITTVAAVHTENFADGITGVAAAKAEVFDSMKPGGTAIINRDNPFYDMLVHAAREKGIDRIYGFGRHTDAEACLLSCIVAANGTRVVARVMGQEVSFALRYAGEHVAMNALAVLLAVHAVGADVQKAAQALVSVQGLPGRGSQEKIESGDPQNPITLIDESYNASPTSMAAAFKVLALIDPGRGGRRIAILGDMLELGPDSPKMHRDLALPLRAANVDLVYTCGRLMEQLHENLPANQRGAHRATSEELAEIVPDALAPGDVVMVKGSHGSRMDLVVEALRQMPARRKASEQTSTAGPAQRKN